MSARHPGFYVLPVWGLSKALQVSWVIFWWFFPYWEDCFLFGFHLFLFIFIFLFHLFLNIRNVLCLLDSKMHTSPTSCSLEHF